MATITIAAEADISVLKVADAGPHIAGGQATYTLTISNAGPSGAQNVSVEDTLPSGFAFASSGSCTEESGSVTCAFCIHACEQKTRVT